MIAVIYTVVRIAETHTIKSERPLWHELCEFSHVKGYIQTVYKPRPQSRRLYIHLIFASFMVGTCSSQGKSLPFYPNLWQPLNLFLLFCAPKSVLYSSKEGNVHTLHLPFIIYFATFDTPSILSFFCF